MVRQFACCIAALPLIFYGCGGRSEEIAFDRAAITSIAQCPDTGDKSITKLCIVDDQGVLYSPFGDAAAPDHGMLTVPAGRAIGVVYVFGDGYVPEAADVTSDAVRAYVAPDNVSNQIPGTSCCAEMSETNRVSATAVLQGNTLTQRLVDVPPSGVQVATIIDFGALYKSRIAASPCTLPAGGCSWGHGAGYADRFYVGGEPPRATGPATQPDGG